MEAIGAKGPYVECSNNVSDNFYDTGDRKYLPASDSYLLC